MFDTRDFNRKRNQMTLENLMEQLDSLDDDLTIYAEKNPDWSVNSSVAVFPEPEDGGVPSEARGMNYLLEVFLAKEAVQGWSECRDGREPTATEKCEAIIYYAEHDAYLPV